MRAGAVASMPYFVDKTALPVASITTQQSTNALTIHSPRLQRIDCTGSLVHLQRVSLVRLEPNSMLRELLEGRKLPICFGSWNLEAPTGSDQAAPALRAST